MTNFPALQCFAIGIAATLYSAASLGQPSDQNSGCHTENGQLICEEKVASPSSAHTDSDKKPAASNGNNLYWIPVDQLDLDKLTPEQRLRLKTGCCGAYLPPKTDNPQSDLPPEQADTHITIEPGGRVSGDPTTVMQVTGRSTIQQGSRTMTADNVELNEVDQTSTVQGSITILDSGSPESSSLIIGEKAIIDRETGETKIDNGQFIFYQSLMRGSASQIHRDGASVTLVDGSFTQCEPGQESWLIRGSEITLDQETEQGSARNMRLELWDVPVFYFPYITFPIGDKSKTGFLYPSISTEDIPIPYFISFAPNLDLTVTPRYIFERGTSLELEGRHLASHFQTIAYGAYLPNGKDDVSDNERDAINDGNLTLEQATEFDGEDRWLAGIQQTGGFGEKWYTQIDANKVSDYNYFHQIDTANLEVNRSTYLRQMGEVGYIDDHWAYRAHWEQFQNLVLTADEPYKQKPRLAADGGYQWGDFALNLRNEVTRFEASEDTPTDINGNRLRTNYQLDWRNEWLAGFVTPSVLLQTLTYQLDGGQSAPGTDDNPSYVVPQGSLDMGLFFEREGSWFGGDYLQTFEPRVFYFYSDYENQDDIANVDFDTNDLTFSYNQLFRHTRFSGGDRIDDANQVSVGLTTRFLGGESGKERLSLSIGQIFYQNDRLVTLSGAPITETESEIAGQISAQLTDSLRFTTDLLYDPATNKTTKGNINLRYLDDEFRIFNLGYRYLRKPAGGTAQAPINNDENQLELSAVWPVTDSWSVIARNYHDFTNNRELDTILGLEYTSCCYRIRLMGRRWLDNELINQVNDLDLEYENGIFFEIHLRGLGLNLGNRMNSALEQGIINYERREEHFLESSSSTAASP